MATDRTATPSRRTLHFGLPAVLVLFVVAGVVSYSGTRGGFSAATPAPTAKDAAAKTPEPAGPVVSINLPYDEPELPAGPHLYEFQVACTTCHSTRLVLTQPAFPKAKWVEVVHKMVATYGAPLTPDDEARAVDYLAAIRGK